MGYKSTEVGMQISFGKGQEKFWTNVFPSELVAKHADDIKKFGRVLQVIKKLGEGVDPQETGEMTE